MKTQETNEEVMSNIDEQTGQMGGVVNTNIYKSTAITVDLSKYQNIKLYSSYSICSDGLSGKEERKLNKKIWSNRGEDLKYGLKCCLKKIAKMEKPKLNLHLKDELQSSELTSATIKKSCEISVEIVKTSTQYQNAKFSSGKEWSIEYSSEEERKKIESEKWDEIAEDIESSMGLFFESLGKKTDAPEKFSELCKKRMEFKKIENDVQNK